MGKEIGIDFGTTTTEVSYIDKNGHSRSMKLEAGEDVIPTVLYFKSEDEYIIGRTASTMGRIHPEASVKNFKLYFTDPTKRFQVVAENGDQFMIKPVRAAQLFLNKLIHIIQPKLLKEFGTQDGTIDKAVITVPAQFDPEEKAAVKNAIYRAASQAGFTDIKVAAEPTAAAVAFQEENCEDGETILVYDFGGGTFDVSVIRKSGEIYREIATDGDKHLGGNLLTEKIAKILWDKCLKAVKRDYPFDEEGADDYCEEDYGLSRTKYLLNRNVIFDAAEDMKVDFLEEDEADAQVSFYFDNESDPRLISLEMGLDEFEDIIREDIRKTIGLTNRVLNETMKRGDIARIDQVVLAGGSSQIRLIQRLLSENKDLKDVVGGVSDSLTLIARGAARLASVELKVEERTRFELGTRVLKGKQLDRFEPIIKAGEKLPCSGTHRFYLAHKGQREVTIEYYEKDVKNYPSASRIDDDGINLVSELAIAGIPEQEGLSMDVTFSIETDGTPTIKAKILDDKGREVIAGQLTVTRGGNLY